jgi:transglutaminase-like putative cysteine protease
VSWYRFANHLTLALACAGWAVAEASYLPEMIWAALLVLGMLLLSFHFGTRWSLPLWAANLAGVVILIGSGVWLVQQFQEDNPLLGAVPVPAVIIPYVGPFLVVLLLVKVFYWKRPDFWFMQGIGFAFVALGCILASNAWFGLLLLGYLVSAVWSLALANSLHSIPEGSETAPVCSGVTVGAVLRWTFLTALAALALFFVTPRPQGESWNPFTSYLQQQARHTQTGLTDSLDLNSTGFIHLNQEVAFTVRVENADGSPRTDLPADQRWRSGVLDRYTRGMWVLSSRFPDPMGALRPGGPPGIPGGPVARPLPPPGPGPVAQPPRELPNFGPDQSTFHFQIQIHKAGGLVLADPILFGPAAINRLPVRALAASGQPTFALSLFSESAGTLVSSPSSLRLEFRYAQVTRPWTSVPDLGIPEAGMGQAVRIDDAQLFALCNQPVAGLTEYTDELLARLVADERYALKAIDLERRPWLGAPPRPEGERLPVSQVAAPEKVAKALERYLSHSGEFTYSLEMRRHDENLDPILDFLRNVKEGHCTRYAASLALMLRSQGIPSRIVTGFSGVEAEEEPGHYLVRQSAAHSWVEALVPRAARPEVPGAVEEFPEARTWHWLTLDPQPVGESSAAPSGFDLGRFWADTREWARWFWRERILDFGADEQADLWSDLLKGRNWRAVLRLASLLAASVALVFFVRWSVRKLLRRSGPGSAPTVAFYARLLELLHRHAGLTPGAAQTPREFGVVAAHALRERGALALADVPARVVEQFYRVRYGEMELAASELREVAQDLRRLELGLKR